MADCVHVAGDPVTEMEYRGTAMGTVDSKLYWVWEWSVCIHCGHGPMNKRVKETKVE